MKIGILTLFQSDSFGALLQAYALQQTLNGLGVESELIRLPTRPKTGPEKRFAKIQNAVPLAGMIRREFLKRCSVFDEFRKKYLKISQPYSFEDAELIDRKYDAFIVGSDQVWNTALPDVDVRYFLPFADDAKKYSYAASFGKGEISGSAKQNIREYLLSFRRLSVREESGRKLVMEMTGREADVHVDPVFLPERSFWEDFSEPSETEKYLLVYMLFENADMLAYANEYAGKHRLKIRFVSECLSFKLGFDAWNATGVPEWLGLIRNADAVITNSFHGIVFSILFRKKFCFFPLKDAAANRNDRISNLLSCLNMTGNHIGTLPENAEDWSVIQQFVEMNKTKSLEYLRMIIKEHQDA